MFYVVVKEEGLGYGRIARIFRDIRTRKKEMEDKSLPLGLSLDEIQTKKGHKYATVISSRIQKRVLDIIKGKDAKRVKSALSKYSEKERKKVKAVIMDWWRPFKKVAKELFPDALIIPDKYHLVSDVHRALDQVRRHLQKGEREKGLRVEISSVILSHMEREFGPERRKKIWGIRFLLLKNGEDLNEEEKERGYGMF